jgi:hypothetical protein
MTMTGLLGIGSFLVGVGATALAFWCCWRKVLPRLRMWLALFGGLTVGIGVLSGLASWTVGVVSGATSHLAAYGTIAMVCGVVLAAELIHTLNPKTKHKGHRWVHPILAFVAPALMLAFGGLFAEAAGWLHAGATQLPDMSSFLVRR